MLAVPPGCQKSVPGFATRLIGRRCGTVGRRSWYGVIVALSFSLSAMAEQEPPVLDWVPIKEMTEEQKLLLRPGCCGAYIAPQRQDAEAQIEPEQASIRIEADRAERDADEQLTLEGEVHMTQGYRSLQANCLRYDRATEEAEAEGQITIREPGLLLHAERAQMNLETGDALLDQAEFVFHEESIRGRAENLERVGTSFLGLSGSAITSCAPGQEDWVLRSSKLNLYPERHYGTARHARLKLFHVPVFYSPYLRFPIGDHRQTGFLFPSFGESSRNGTEISLPFYWNIAPNYDLTVTPEYLSKRGVLWHSQGRQLSKYFETNVGGSWISSDDGGFNRRLENQIEQGLITEEEAYPYRGEERWQLNIDQTGGQGQRWSTLIDYTDLSDNDYLRDLDSSALDVNRQAVVSKTAQAGYQFDHWRLGIRAEELRSLSTAKWPHRELPRINADGLYLWHDWVLELNNEYAKFDVNSTFESENETDLENIIVGERVRTDYGLTWNKEWFWGFAKPRVGYKTLGYDLEDHNLVADANSSPRLSAPEATLDSGLYFERFGDLFGTPYLQTLEPRVFYFYREAVDHSELYEVTENNRPVNFDTKPLTFSYAQLYRTTRFAGGDRLEDANQISLGLSTRFIDPLTGVERLSISMGQIFHFEDRQVGLTELKPSEPREPGEELPPGEEPPPVPDHERSRSELAGQITARVSDRFLLSTDFAYDDIEHELASASASMRYLDDAGRILNLSYRFQLRPPSPGQLNPEDELERSLDQIDVSFHWPVYGQLSLIGRGHYDITYERELDSFVGLEYNDCCYRVRLLARRWLDFDYAYSPDFLETVSANDYEDSIVFDIQFKGLGSVNRKIGDLLEKAIPGYEQRETSYINN